MADKLEQTKSLYQVKLEKRKKKSKKDTIVTDMDYILRQKKGNEADKANYIDMTPDGVKPGDYEAKYAKEIEELKAKVQENTDASTSTKDKEIEELKKQVAMLIEAQTSKEETKTGRGTSKAQGDK